MEKGKGSPKDVIDLSGYAELVEELVASAPRAEKVGNEAVSDEAGSKDRTSKNSPASRYTSAQPRSRERVFKNKSWCMTFPVLLLFAFTMSSLIVLAIVHFSKARSVNSVEARHDLEEQFRYAKGVEVLLQQLKEIHNPNDPNFSDAITRFQKFLGSQVEGEELEAGLRPECFEFFDQQVRYPAQNAECFSR
ncbi:MAG: hypothetical protein KDD60_04950 [Bdellovibrionales bacterium]|nr:hypothetical protein [Bdellovibrionales bacterium]